MAIGRIEPTGCVAYKGKIQLRLSFYLEPSDPRYEEHHVQVPVIPPEGYQGEVDAKGRPANLEDYNNWIGNLPKEWQTNPFHNHFIYVTPSMSDTVIRNLMQHHLHEFYVVWGKGEDIAKGWKKREPFVAGNMSSGNILKCQKRVDDIKKQPSFFDVREVL